MRAQTITIIGLDRVGASIGLALQATGMEITVAGFESNRELADKAQEGGAVGKLYRSLSQAAAEADILILSLPMAQLEEALQVIGSELQAHALVIDLAPRKGPGLKWTSTHLRQGHYVGAAPVLAADRLGETGQGFETARADLFLKSVFCIMPSPEAAPKAVETAVNVGRALGATPFFLDAMEYDALVQGVRTVPGLLAAALFRAVQTADGWRDMLRFAGPSFALSTWPLEDVDLPALAMQDKVSTLRWLDALAAELQQVRRWIADGDEERLALILDDLAATRARWLRDRAENDWSEEPEQDELDYSMRTALFGTLLSSGKKKDRKS